MERIDTDARYFKKWYDEVSEPPELGVKWVLNDGKSKGTVKAVEPLYQHVDNDVNDEYYMYDFYKITFGDIELGIEIEDEDDFFDALRAAGDSNSDKLIKLAEEIGKDELIAIVLDYDFSLYDYSLKWAINQILN